MAFLTFSLGLEQKPSQLKSTALIRATAMPVCPCRRETGLLHSAEHLLLRGAGLLRVPSPVLDRHAADTTGSGPTASTQPPCLRFPPSDIEDLGGIKLGTSTAYPGSRGLEPHVMLYRCPYSSTHGAQICHMVSSPPPRAPKSIFSHGGPVVT